MEPSQVPTQSPVAAFDSQPKSHWSMIFLSVVGIILLSAIVFLYLQNQKLQKKAIDQQVALTIQNQSSITNTESLTSTPPDEMVGWKTYVNNKFGFEFKYPKEYQIDDKDFDLLNEKNQFNQKNLCFSPYESLYITQTKFAPRTQVPQLRLHAVTSNREINEIIRDCYSDKLASWKSYLAEKTDLFQKTLTLMDQIF